MRPPIISSLFAVFAWVGLTGSAVIADQDWRAELTPPAETVTVQSVVLPTQPDLSFGLKVTVAAGCPAQVGYDTFTIEVASLVPAAVRSDRKLELIVRPQSTTYVPPRNGVTVRVPIEVPQSSRPISITRLIPKYFYGNAYEVSLREDGRQVAAGSATLGRGQRPSADLSRNILQSSPPEARWLVLDLHDTRGTGGRPRPGLISPHGPMKIPQTMRRVVDARSLPQDWRSLQMHSVIAMDMADLETLQSRFASRLKAIVEITSAGAIMIIVDGIGHAQRIAEILNCPYTPDPDPRVDGQPADAFMSHFFDPGRWNLPDVDDSTATNWSRLGLSLPPQVDMDLMSQVHNQKNAIGSVGGYGSISFRRPGLFASDGDVLLLDSSGTPIPFPDQVRQELTDQRRRLDTARRRFQQTGFAQVIPVGAGTVFAIMNPPDVPLGMNPHVLQAILEDSLSPSSNSLYRGVDPLLGDQRFADALIESVGRPPVFAFMGLLLLFVVSAGPIAYRWTWVNGRTHWMLWIAPTLATATTATLFLYSVVADGWETKARVRQITYLNGQSGDGFRRTRSTYFANIASASGLRFAADADVIPYVSDHGDTWLDRIEEPESSLGTITLTDQSQILTGGFSPSRAQCQYVVHRPVRGVGTLHLEASADSTSPQLVSRIPGTLSDVLLRDRTGQYWLIPSIDGDGVGVPCQAIKPDTASRLMALWYAMHSRTQLNNLERLHQSNRSIRSTYLSVPIDQVSDFLALLANASGKHFSVDGDFEYRLRSIMRGDSPLSPGQFVASAPVDTDDIAAPSATLDQGIQIIIGTIP